MSKKMGKWKNPDGSIKIHMVRTPVGYDTTLEELKKYMEFLGVAPQSWRLFSDSYSGKVTLVFLKDEVSYKVEAEKQTNSKGKASIKDNARVIFHLVQARVLEMRKGVETLESAFGGFVDWLNTPKLPPKMTQELQTRGMEKSLPPPTQEVLP